MTRNTVAFVISLLLSESASHHSGTAQKPRARCWEGLPF